MDRLVQWTGDIPLLLNVEKTKKIVFNFRRKEITLRLLHILDRDWKLVEDHKYLFFKYCKEFVVTVQLFVTTA